jgi:chromosome segregation ATPase
MVNKHPTEEGREEDVLSEKEIDMEEEVSDSFYQNEMRAAEIQRLSQRITTLALLIPGLVGVLLIIGYLDLRFRVNQIQTVGSRKVETFSEDIVEKLDSLSYQYETLDASLSAGLTALQKSTASMRERVARSEKILEDVVKSKVETTSFAALQKDVDGQQESLAKLADELRGKLTEDGSILMVLQNDLMGQKREIASLRTSVTQMRDQQQARESSVNESLEDKVDEETLHLSLGEERARYERTMEVFEETVSSLDNTLSRLERRITILEASIDEAQAEGRLKEETPLETGPATEPLLPDRILEQEIQP